MAQINVREYRRDNKKWTVQINWQHKIHNSKNKSKHNTICVGHHYTQTNTNNAKTNIHCSFPAM